jgi:hypothetical protein
MTNSLQPVEPHEAWFKTLLGHLYYALESLRTSADAEEARTAWAAVKEYLSLLHTEAEVLQHTFEHTIQLIQTLQQQRDEALTQRDEALVTQQDAYLRGLLMQEEQRLGNDWTDFGVVEQFSLGWLREILEATDEAEAAEKVAWVEQYLVQEVQALAAFRQQRRAAYSNPTLDD